MTTSIQRTAVPVLIGISLSHLINDMLQSLLPAIYPMLKTSFALNFWQIGLITLASQLTASLLQPFVGMYTDRRPQPHSLAAGMGFTIVGLVALGLAHRFALLVAAAAMIGVGSSVFHPESSRIARLASGGRHGLAQSLFQTGGNVGSALGPLLAAFIVLPHGQSSIVWFAPAAFVGMIMLGYVGAWYTRTHVGGPPRPPKAHAHLSRRQVQTALVILVALVFSKFIYLTSLSNYYTFYLIDHFHVSVRNAQLHLFAFLGAVAVGTFAGGPIGDRFGRKLVIWVSILGVLPFTLMLPSVNLFWTGVLSVVIGLILSSAFSAILVFAQELLPGRVGAVAGLFFGFAFGVGGLGAAALGRIADLTSIEFVYRVVAFMPAIGLLTAWLPNLRPTAATRASHGPVKTS